MVARLVRYGPVRQKATFLKDAVASEVINIFALHASLHAVFLELELS